MEFQLTRLAPSPTGALHLGHARTFLIAWWMARRAGARIVMRMEDLDAGRAKPESVGQAYEDLRWLGMDWDGWDETQNIKHKTGNTKDDTQNTEQATETMRRGVVQSERLGVYAGVLQGLWERDAVYPCTCSRAKIAEMVAGVASAPHVGDFVMRYPGTCAGRTLGVVGVRDVGEAARKVEGETGGKVCWRLRVEGGVIGFEDLIAGSQRFDVAGEVGDFPLTRFDGTPAYQLACVVDDHAMGIDRVVRGDDLLSSTPRQICLYRAMGWGVPEFAHVPLVVGVDGKRLAKRHGESRIAQFREGGVRAERVVGWVAWRSGMIEGLREMSAGEGVGVFDLGRLPRERVVLGEEDLRWLR